ncbi:unnamed protein product [Microthlaspi erraticum]|uniref:Arabidopsis retrotransposon Orf1 C-terminal domain-containing protein n=1 Tax=Microthlaspi erraticum TaxID=1685480 RepID=A0A6D2JPN3_9BRAS|nr:unnamed protein product [Microthlaspi erraticum]
MSKEDVEEIERLREERRTKRRNDPISSESELGEFEIGVNVAREESDDSQSEEGEEVNQEVDGSGQESNEDVPMAEAEPQEEEDDLPMFQAHYDALFSMDFVETKYPHDGAMKALGIFKDVELVLKNMHLAKFFSHRMESYKELTCEFLASMRYHEYNELDRADLDQGWGWITFLAKGEKKMVTFRQLEILFGFTYGEGTNWDIKENELQSVWATIAEGEYSSLRSKAAQIRSHVLRYVHKALASTFFARKATGTINEGDVKLLDMGIKPIISRASDGRKLRGDRVHAGNLMPLLDQLLSYKTTAYSTRFQGGRRLSIGGIITSILCAAGVQLNKKNSPPAGWMDIKFYKTNTLIDHKELNGKYQFLFKHPTAGASKMLLPNPEFTSVREGRNIDFNCPLHTLVGHEDELREEEPELDRVEARAEDHVQENEELGEPNSYYFEEYEAPRMNPSVVAAHKRIGLLQRYNKWQGKAMKKMQKSMDKMVSKIKSLEKKVAGSLSKKNKAPMTFPFPRSRSLLTTPRRLPSQEPHRASSFEPREERASPHRRRKSSRARPSNSTSGLDRVQTEET